MGELLQLAKRALLSELEGLSAVAGTIYVRIALRPPPLKQREISSAVTSVVPLCRGYVTVISQPQIDRYICAKEPRAGVYVGLECYR